MAPAWHNRPHATFPADVRLFLAGTYCQDIPMVLTVYRETDGAIYLAEAHVTGWRLNRFPQEDPRCTHVLGVAGKGIDVQHQLQDPDCTKPADQIGIEAVMFRQARDVDSVLAAIALEAIEKVERGNDGSDAAADAVREAA